jgi:hypothetical protein
MCSALIIVHHRSCVQRVIIIVRGELPPKSSMEEDLQSYISMNTYLDSQDPWFWQKIRYARQGWKKPGFLKKKPSPVGFFGFFWVFWVFLGFFGFFARTRGLLGFFSVSRILLGASRL